MRVRASRGAAALLGAVVAAALLPGSTASADHLERRKRSVDEALGEQGHDLHESSVAVRRAAAELSRTAVALPAAERRLAAAEGELAAARARAEQASAAVRAANAAVDAADRAHQGAQAALASAREQLNDTARWAYINMGGGAPIASLMAADSPTDFLLRGARWRSIMKAGDQRVALAATARAAVASRRSVLVRTRADVAAREQAAAAALERVRQVTAAAASARADVAREVAARRSALAVAERERAADLRDYQRLQAESRRLGDLIRRAAVSRGTGRVGRGGMVWPTNGVLTSRYGYRMHPIYGYRRFHAGIDIGAPTGRPIIAALAGTVVQAGPLGSYGNIVVIDHGNGFATAYAHQSRVLVRRGQRVARGQRIGLVGSTGASTGPHLHFETRVNGEPVDPMRYY